MGVQELKQIIDSCEDVKAQAVSDLREIIVLHSSGPRDEENNHNRGNRDIIVSKDDENILDQGGLSLAQKAPQVERDMRKCLKPFSFRCSCGFSPSSEAGLTRHLDQSSKRPWHMRVQVRFVDLETETDEWLPDEVPSAVVVPQCEQVTLQDGKERIQETLTKSGNLDVPDQTELEDHLTMAKRWLEWNKAERIQSEQATLQDGKEQIRNLHVSDQTELEDHLIEAKRWLERNKAERIQNKQATLQDGKEEIQERLSKSGSLEVFGQTELEDHLTEAKRWLERNKAERMQKKMAFSAEKFNGQAPLNHTVNTEVASSLTQLNKSQTWLEQNEAARVQKKIASSVEKFDEEKPLKHTVDPEVASWLIHLRKSLELVTLCQRRNATTVAATNDKLEKTFENIRNCRELRPGLWPDCCRHARLKRGKWESQADVKLAQKARKEAAILLTSSIERVYVSTMLGFSRE